MDEGGAREARSGLAPWTTRELPEAPRPRGLQWMSAVGPGVIVLGAALGSGEFLLGPAAFLKHGLSLLWVTSVAALLQTFFNMELMRWTMATGEPAFTGFMRTRPTARFWAWFYALLCLLQVGWPAWAGTAAGAFLFLGTGRVAGDADRVTIQLIAAAAFGVCVLALVLGRRIERTLELLNWVLVLGILAAFLAFALVFGSGEVWGRALAGLFGFDVQARRFSFLPAGGDALLLGAFAAYSGLGGVGNLMLSNWARDKGYGMARHAGYIASASSARVELAPSGFRFEPTPAHLERWRGWWRIARADQWAIYFPGALLGMTLPAVVYLSLVAPGTEIRGLGVAAALASAMESRAGHALGVTVAAMGAWMLFKTQLDFLEGMVRAVTDILWTSSARARRSCGGDVRKVYYFVLAIAVVWGVLALGLAAPVFLLQLGANVAGLVFVVAALHLLRINTTLLPPALRPSLPRRAALLALALFYAFFVSRWLLSIFGA